MENENKTQKDISVSKELLFALMGIISLGLLVLCKILVNFGVGSAIFYGIMSMFIYILPFVGVILSYCANKKVSFELVVNLAAFVIAMLVF